MKIVKVFFSFLLFNVLFVLVPPVHAAVIFDMSNIANWNIRIDGATAGDRAGGFWGDTSFIDLNGDNKKDLLIEVPGASNNGRTRSGSIYIILNSILASYPGVGNTIDLNDSSKWNLRIDGTSANNNNGFSFIIADFNNNGEPDLLIHNYFESSHDRSMNGSAYLINNNLISPYLNGTTGNSLDLANSANWNIRIDGSSNNSSLCYELTCIARDINDDNKLDLLATGKGSSGDRQVYLLYNSLLVTSSTGNILDLNDPTSFNIKFTGQTVGDSLGSTNINAVDLYSTGEQYLLMSAVLASYNGRYRSGSVYVIPYHFFSNLTGTGNTYSLTSTSNYFIRYDGSAVNEWLADFSALNAKDIDNNGKPDLLIGTLQPVASPYGHVYIIKDSLLSGFSGTSNNVDLANPNNYNLDITALGIPTQYHGFGVSGDFIHDHFGLGKYDLLLDIGYASNPKIGQGSIYVLSNNKINSYSGTGNHIDLGDLADYSLRYDGASAGDNLNLLGSINGNGETDAILQDFNDDGKPEILLSSSYTGYNERSPYSGSVYIIYNFPHTITITNPSSSITTSVNISGTVSAPDSTTAVAGVQYSVDDNSPSSNSWTNCSGTTNFTCSVNNLALTRHDIYIRAYDTNGSYTSQSHYFVYGVGNSDSTSTDPNCKVGFKYCINAGPNYTKNTSYIQTFVDNSWAGTIIPYYVNHDDMYVTVKRLSLKDLDSLGVAYPWSQGLNTYSDIYQFSAVSAFNGYPIILTDKPFTVQIPFNKTKLNGISPTSLKTTYFDSRTRKWKTLTTPQVVDWVNNIISTTTKNFAIHTLTYPSNDQTKATSDKNKVVEETAQKLPISTATPIPAKSTPKHCFLWWCW